MRLSAKDMVGTLLAAAAVGVTLAVTNGWGWPLLADYRAGAIALAVIGFAMCGAGSDYSTVRGPNPFVVLAAVMGVAALILMIAAIGWPSATVFVWLAVTIVALWFVTTLRHATTPVARPATA
jgi:hypothetical protein